MDDPTVIVVNPPTEPVSEELPVVTTIVVPEPESKDEIWKTILELREQVSATNQLSLSLADSLVALESRLMGKLDQLENSSENSIEAPVEILVPEPVKEEPDELPLRKRTTFL